ncbi:MAG: hypothetical protein ACM31L_13085 [Actinomycetota bacterium]
MTAEDQPPGRRRLPRHVIAAISVGLGFAIGMALLVWLPRFGMSPKAAGFVGLVVWMISTYPLWGFGSEGGKNS